MEMLFGYLASRFVTQRENLATEALAFILNHSDRMREAFRGLVGRTGIALPELVRFHPQRRDEQGIPDLVASDAKGAEPLLVESKFWAGLTENQPAGYLDRLPTEGGGALVFVVPRQRLASIWRELVTSVRNQHMTLPNPEHPSDDHLLFARLSPSKVLAATTWDAVLGSLDAAARATGDTFAEGNIAQLKSLCEASDRDAFLPLSKEELTNLEVPQRLIGLADLVRDLVDKAAASKIVDLGGTRDSHGWYHCGRYFRIGAVGAWMGIHHQWRLRFGITPLWISFPNRWGSDTQTRFVLESIKGWPEFFETGDTNAAIVPLRMSPDVVRDRVLEDLLQQLQSLRAMFEAASGRTSTASVQLGL